MRATPAVTALLWALAIGFGLQWLGGVALQWPLMLWPLGEYSVRLPDGGVAAVGFMPWQLVTYAFLHDGFGHLFFNGLGLWMFGAPVEQAWGHRRFLVYWFVCVVGAGLLQLAVVSFAGPDGGLHPTLGASGGVYGLLLAYAMLFPHHRVMLLIPPIPMKARTFAIVFGALALVSGVLGTASGIAHFAHLGGMVAGWLLIRFGTKRAQ